MPEYTPKDGWGPYIIDCRRRAETKYAGRNRRIQNVIDHRFNRIEPKIPPKYKQIAEAWKLPLVRQLVRATQALLAANLPTPKQFPSDPLKPTSRAQADNTEKWLKQAYLRMGLRVFLQITDALAGDAETVWKTTMRTHRFGTIKREEGEEDDTYNGRVKASRQQHFPFVWEHVDTRTWFPIDEDADGVVECLEVTRREARPIAAQYKLASGPNGLVKLSDIGQVAGSGARQTPSGDTSQLGTCRWTEFWDRWGHFVYMVDDTVVKVGKHPYRRCPYYHSLFSVTSLHDPEFQTEGLADPLTMLQDKLEQSLTVHGNWMMLAGFPIAHLVPTSDDAIPLEAKDQQIVIEPGGTIAAPLGYKWEWVELPAAGRDLTQMYDRLMEQADRISLAPILFGHTEASRMSGPAMATLVAIGKSIFGPAEAELARQFDEQAAWILEMVEREIKAPVPIWLPDTGEKDAEKKPIADWLELDDTKIGGYYLVSHTLIPVIPMEQMQKQTMLSDLHARGVITTNRLLEDGANITAPDEEIDARWLENHENSPQFDNLVMTEFLRRIGQEQGGGSNAQQMALIGQSLMQIGQALASIQMGQAGATPSEPPVGPPGPAPQLAGVQQPIAPGTIDQMAAR